MRPGASDEGHVRVRRASQGSRVKGGRRDEQWLSGAGASGWFCEKVSVESWERVGCIELGREYSLGV